MGYVIENIRLTELIIVVRQNKPFYEEFLTFLNTKGYKNIHEFINDSSDERSTNLITEYLNEDFDSQLLDGIGQPYKSQTAKWYFLAWLLRDAPAQRLAPLLSSVQGRNPIEKKANLLNEIRKFVAPLFPDTDSWTWAAISEVMLARLEGSRRALKGGLFENIVRTTLKAFFKEKNLKLTTSNKEIKLNEESYDVQIVDSKESILVLMPVKTRETMGGGHASLFTRDIHKSISVATQNGYKCIPVIIAESWAGHLAKLPCEYYIYITMNPNQIDQIKPALKQELSKLLPFFKKLATTST